MSKKFLFVVLSVLLLQAVGAQSYDKNVVVKVMRGNMTLLNGLKADLGLENYSEAADKFYQFAKGMSTILPFTPKKGTKTEWDRVLGTFIETSLKGALASLRKDKVKSLAALDELQALNKEGHGVFK